MRQYEFTAREGDKIVNEGTCTSPYNLRAVAVFVFIHCFGRHPTGGSFGVPNVHGEAWDKYHFRQTIKYPKNHKEVTIFQIHYDPPLRRGLLLPERAQSLVEREGQVVLNGAEVIASMSALKFLTKLALHGCEAGPFKNGKTCLDIDGIELHYFAGLKQPCWPCQALRIAKPIPSLQ